MIELHQAIHESTGMCLWTILAALVLAIFAIVTITHIAKQKERDKEFSKAMEEKYGIVMTERR